MIRAVMFTTPEEHPNPWILCRKPELLFFLFPTVHVAGTTFEPDGLLRLKEGGRLRLVAVMMSDSGRELPGRIPVPLLRLRSSQLSPEHLQALLARVRDLVETDRPREELGWAA